MGRVMTILAVIGVVAAAYFTYRYGVGGVISFFEFALGFFPGAGIAPGGAVTSFCFAKSK